MNLRVEEELDLLFAILNGYQPSLARSDALRAVKVLRGELTQRPVGRTAYLIGMSTFDGFLWKEVSQVEYDRTEGRRKMVTLVNKEESGW